MTVHLQLSFIYKNGSGVFECDLCGAISYKPYKEQLTKDDKILHFCSYECKRKYFKKINRR